MTILRRVLSLFKGLKLTAWGAAAILVAQFFLPQFASSPEGRACPTVVKISQSTGLREFVQCRCAEKKAAEKTSEQQKLLSLSFHFLAAGHRLPSLFVPLSHFRQLTVCLSEQGRFTQFFQAPPTPPPDFS